MESFFPQWGRLSLSPSLVSTFQSARVQRLTALALDALASAALAEAFRSIRTAAAWIGSERGPVACQPRYQFGEPKVGRKDCRVKHCTPGPKDSWGLRSIQDRLYWLSRARFNGQCKARLYTCSGRWHVGACSVAFGHRSVLVKLLIMKLELLAQRCKFTVQTLCPKTCFTRIADPLQL